MSKSRHTEARNDRSIEAGGGGTKVEDVAREVGVSSTRSMAGRRSTAGWSVNEVQEVKQLREEHGRLKKLVADLSLDKDALQSVIRKNGWSSQSVRRLSGRCAKSMPSASGGRVL